MSDTLNKSERLVAGIAVVKENLTTALQNKGVTVPPEARLKDLPALVDSIEVGGGGSTTDKQVLVLSGFSSSETAIYGVDLNGEYVLVSADVSSYDRVWVCEANGVQLMYKSAWGYWGLVNNTASGGNTYTYGEGNNPYKADGSSTQWQTQGANISATAVVKGSNNGGGSGSEPEGYTITYFENYPNLEGNYLKANTPSWGDSSYEYYKHQDIDVYLYIAGSNAVFRSFDEYGFTSDYWFSSNIGNNIVGNLLFMNENSGTMWNVTVTQG